MDAGTDSAGVTTDALVVSRRRRTARREQIGTVTYGAPALDRGIDPDGGIGVRISFAFEPLSARWSCVALFLRMSFDDRRIEVVDAGIDPVADSAVDPAVDPAVGPTVAPSHGAAPGAVSVTGLSSNVVGWYFDRLNGDPPPEVRAHATLNVPRDLAELTGTVRAELPVVRTGLLHRRRAHARAAQLQEFALPLPGRRSGIAAPVDSRAVASSAAGSTSGPTAAAVSAHAPKNAEPDAAVRLCCAADIERYSRFRTPEAVRAQQRLTEALARARHHAGIAEERVETQESGDGQFVVLPTGLDESEVIPALVHGFRIALAEVNADLNERARLRLRIALHRGHVERGANGWAGDSAVGVHRLLDSGPARAALTGRPDADFALIVSDTLYQDVIAHGYGLLRPEAFTRVEVEIPAKHFAERAWIYVPEPW